jgi:uncharacterized membrane protein HdeD (DUF308 family)
MEQIKSFGNQPWWLRAAVGVVAIVLGIWALTSTEQALTVIGLIAGGYLLFAGIVATYGAWRVGGGFNLAMIYGLAGIIGGLLLLFMAWQKPFDGSTTYAIAAIALMAFGAIGLALQFFVRGRKRIAWGAVLVNALLVIWGVLILFFNANEGSSLVQWSAFLLIALGVATAGWAGFQYWNARQTPAA